MLDAVAEHGFVQFTERLEEAKRAGPAEQALNRLCRAYVDFGQEHWGVYKLMFSRRTLATTAPGSKLASLADTAFELLATHVSERVAEARKAQVAVTIWAALHGLVMLSVDALLAGPLDRKVSLDGLVEEILTTFTV